MTQDIVDGRLVRGAHSRRVILDKATDIASIEGLDGLSIGRLAEAVGHSKSGVATLFGSKESLQLATVAAAREIFTREVVEAARTHTERGLARVVALMVAWLDYSQRRVFPGGCFFAAASVEFDSKPGAVRDAVRDSLAEWQNYVTASLTYAAAELPDMDDAEQVSFELTGIVQVSNTRAILLDSDEPYVRAATAVRTRLLTLGATPERLTELDSLISRQASTSAS